MLFLCSSLGHEQFRGGALGPHVVQAIQGKEETKRLDGGTQPCTLGTILGWNVSTKSVHDRNFRLVRRPAFASGSPWTPYLIKSTMSGRAPHNRLACASMKLCLRDNFHTQQSYHHVNVDVNVDVDVDVDVIRDVTSLCIGIGRGRGFSHKSLPCSR